MDGSYMADSRPKKVHATLAIDVADVAAVSIVEEMTSDYATILLRNGKTISASVNAGRSLIKQLDALSRDES